MGSALRVEKKQLTKTKMKPALNGDLTLCNKALKAYKNSEFFDQGIFYETLYGDNKKGVGYSDITKNMVLKACV